MKGSACENFLTTITEMLTTDEVLTAEARQRLQEHASGCDRCHGSQDLIELAGLPATERDPVPWPDDRRFEAMRGAVQQQIESGRKRSPARLVCGRSCRDAARCMVRAYAPFPTGT